MVKVLIMGPDMQSEIGLLRRLQGISGIAGEKMSLCYDLAACDLLVVSDSGELPSAARHLVGQRPQLPLWLIGNDGELHDAFHAPEVRLGEAAIRDVLRSLGAVSAAGVSANEDESHADEFVADMRMHLAAGTGHGVIAMAGNQVLYVDFGKNLAMPAALSRLPADRFSTWLGSAFTQLSLVPIEPTSFAEATADAITRMPLVPLLWQTALRMQAEPVLIAPLDEETCLHLKQWPDFRVLGNRHDDFRLCSLLLKRASTARECSHMLGIDPGATRAFFNAAYLSGYATPQVPDVDAATNQSLSVDSGGSLLAGMWRSLRNRLRS